MSSRFIHVTRFPSFLRLNNFTLYVYISLCLSSHPVMCLDCVHLLAIINSVAMNMGVKISV